MYRIYGKFVSVSHRKNKKKMHEHLTSLFSFFLQYARLGFQEALKGFDNS